MKRFKSILCASLLTLAMSSATFAGDIYSAPEGTDASKTATTADTKGIIYSIKGIIYSITGIIYC